MPLCDPAAAALTVQKLQRIAELQLPAFLFMRNRQHPVLFYRKKQSPLGINMADFQAVLPQNTDDHDAGVRT